MMKKIMGILLLTAVVAAVTLGYLSYTFVYTPAEQPGSETIVSIAPGQSFAHLAKTLEKKGFITSAAKFRLYAKLSGKDTAIKAGEFVLSSGWSPQTILEALTSGKQVLYRLQIPEGLTWWQIADLVAEKDLASVEDFTKAVHDQHLLRSFGIRAPSAEGYLFPETYFFPRTKKRDAKPLVRTMLQQFQQKVIKELWPLSPPTHDELHRIVTLATLVEKETSVPEERPLVAGVYTNRLRKGMRMQADPTTIYGLGRSFDGNLKKSHLRDASNPYNTYKRSGLPPGPICSPGLAALKAAKSPARHSYLYFVAKGDGSHYFSTNLKEHNRAVVKYQLRRR